MNDTPSGCCWRSSWWLYVLLLKDPYSVKIKQKCLCLMLWFVLFFLFSLEWRRVSKCVCCWCCKTKMYSSKCCCCYLWCVFDKQNVTTRMNLGVDHKKLHYFIIVFLKVEEINKNVHSDVTTIWYFCEVKGFIF